MPNDACLTAGRPALPRVAEPAPCLDILITPPRSLSPRGYGLVRDMVAGTTLAIGGGLVAAGLWPIALMLGGSAGVLLAALAGYRRHAGRWQRLCLDGALLRLEEHWPGRDPRSSSLPALGLAVCRRRDASGATRRLELVSGGACHPVGDDLSPEERDSLRLALLDALRAAGWRPRDLERPA